MQSSLEKPQEEEIDGVLVARYCKWYMQENNPYVQWKLPFAKLPVKTFYGAHRKAFDALAKIVNQFKLDMPRYIEFFIVNLNKRANDINSDLVSMATINRYIDHLQSSERKKEIYEYFQKSVKNIAYDCIKLDMSVKDYLIYLIRTKKIASYYAAGKISKYYLAAIPNFKSLIERMDHLSKSEFKRLYDRFDLYSKEVNEAFLKMKSTRANPIKVTENFILKIRSLRS